MSDIDVLYVGGVPRSGSTLTDLMLDQLPGHVAVGELFYLWHNCVRHDEMCACRSPFSGCSFWTSVGETAFGGWQQVDLAEVERLQSVVDRTSRIPALLMPTLQTRSFRRDLDAYRDVVRRLYAAILVVSGASVVVDSSKRPSLAFVVRGAPGIRLTMAHVVRDPRGVAYSFSKHVSVPRGASLQRPMPRSSARKVMRRWVTVNALIAALRRLGVPYVRIRYEDLVADPVGQLRRVAAAEGVHISAADLPNIGPERLRIPDTHALAAGRVRLVDGTMALRLDDEWRQKMPRRTRWLVSVGTSGTRLRYGYR